MPPQIAEYMSEPVPATTREVKVEAPPQRAVALSQPATEILLALGLEDRMAGANAREDELLPAQQEAYAKVPKLPAEAVSFERVLDAEPDFAYSTFAWSFSDEGVAPRAIAVLAAAGVALALGNIAFYNAADEGDIGVVSVLASLSPLVTALLALAFLHERLERREVIALLVVLGGTALVVV